MSTERPPTAIIADDEPLLVESLQRELQQAWPELQITSTANNGTDAIKTVFEHKPDIVFLDIQMPGASGVEVAQAIAEDWPNSADGHGLPLIVFVTAFNDYATDAFEAAAIDYLVKPVKQPRLILTVQRLQKQLHINNASTTDELAGQLHQLLMREKQQNELTIKAPQLQVVRASSGNQVRIIPISDVILFESADKYVTVYTAQGESLIREPLKKLLPQLDPDKFEQIHRGAIVNMAMIKSATRDETGKITLQLNNIDKEAVVSRVYRHLFQPM